MDFIKKQFEIIIALAAILGIVFGIYKITNRCVLDGSGICYDKKLETFEIEKDAKISVQVESEALGEYLVDTWNTLHPEHVNRVDYVVAKPLDLTRLADDFETDVIVTSLSNSAYVLGDVFDLGKDVEEHILKYSSRSFENFVNETGVYFIPNSVKGWTFIYNKTLAEELGINLEDTNGNRLPDSFESWEKLIKLDKLVFEELDILFPLSFKDQFSFYPFLTSGKWHLNFTGVGNDAGFETREFLSGLEFVEKMSNANLYKEKKEAASLEWQYNTALFERKTVFSMMSDWMNFEEVKTDDEYVLAPFPSFEGNPLRPKGEVDGYLVSKETKYPSASTEAIRILRDAKAFEVYSSSDNKIFVYHRDYIDDLEGDASKIDLVYALNFIDPDPVMLLEDAPTVFSRTFFYEENFMQPIRDLYDGKISTLKAQEEIKAIYEAWFQKQVDEGDVDVEETD